MIAKRYKDGRYTVVSGNGILVLQLPEAEAIGALRARGISEDRARTVLAREVTKGEWSATFVAATAATAAAVEESLSNVAESADVEEIRGKQAELTSAVTELRSEVAADRRNLERRELEESLNARAEQMIGVSVAHGVTRSRFLEHKVWEVLWQSPEGLRLQEIRNED